MGNAFHVIHGLPSFPRGRGGSQEGHGLRIGRPERASLRSETFTVLETASDSTRMVPFAGIT